MIFEMFPFIFLISTQLFFIKLFNNNQIDIFKYSGLKNSKILALISIFTFFLGIFIITIFYSFSSNFKNLYLEFKNNYTADDKYLAVVTKNGLWIKDKIDNKINIINASRIEENFLINTFITQFNDNYEVLQNIKADRIEISKDVWMAEDVEIINNNQSKKVDLFVLNSISIMKKYKVYFQIYLHCLF